MSGMLISSRELFCPKAENPKTSKRTKGHAASRFSAFTTCSHRSGLLASPGEYEAKGTTHFALQAYARRDLGYDVAAGVVCASVEAQGGLLEQGEGGQRREQEYQALGGVES